MPKICEMVGVRHYGSEDDDPVELWFNAEIGRLVARVYNEGGHRATELDILDLTRWVQTGPGTGMVLFDGQDASRADGDFGGN
jgi:hypothetical protein